MQNKIGIATTAASGMGRAGRCALPARARRSGSPPGAGQHSRQRDLPQPVDTPMLRGFVGRPDQQQAPGDADKEALIIRRSQQIPMRRTGKPE